MKTRNLLTAEAFNKCHISSLLKCTLFVDHFDYTLFIEHCQVKEQNLSYTIGGDMMISYEPFYKTLKEKGVSTYKLINTFGISRSLIDRLKHNRPISTVTLNDLCNILNCNVENVIKFTPDKE